MGLFWSNKQVQILDELTGRPITVVRFRNLETGRLIPDSLAEARVKKIFNLS
jgi:hypothetical protein